MTTGPDLPLPVTLHLGAHCCGAGAVQAVLERDAARLAREGLALWTPRRTRTGLLHGLIGDPGRPDTARRGRLAQRAAGRIAMRRQVLGESGARRLILSEPRLLGTRRENVLLARLYPTAWGRLRRLRGALPGIDHICLTVREPGGWWASAIASLDRRCLAMPDRAAAAAMARSRRGWREVIEDMADALPRARITVWTHEAFGARPENGAALLTGRALGAIGDRAGGSAPAADPFDPDQRAALAKGYADDLAWLRAGADGLAHFVTGRPDGPPPDDEEGTDHDRSERRPGEMDRHGREGAPRPDAG